MKRICMFCSVWTILLGLGGCAAVGPDYLKPRSEVPVSWHYPPDPALVPGKEMIEHWWTLFNDPLLSRLIAEAETGNLDLREAVVRVTEARARLGVATGERVPVIETQAGITRRRDSENDLTPGAETTTLYSVGPVASWEIDLFGRIRRSVEAAAADFQAREEDRIDVMVSLYAEVARTYLEIRTFQARLSAAVGNIESQKEVLALTRSRFENGLATGLDVSQAERVLASSEAELPPLRIELSRAMNTMGVLLGQPPGTLYQELSKVKPIPVPPGKVTVGVPSDLLRQRPDIRRAERELAAQTARIGVATADLYPSLSLTGSFAFEALNTGDLFNGASHAFSFGPSLRWLAFDGKRVRNQIRIQDALTEQALVNYERTILNALNEAENALTQYVEQRIRLQALRRSVKAARTSLSLATDLYKDGLTDFQNVLDAQREVFDFENRLAEARGNTSINLVALYRAMGGGWDPKQISADYPKVKPTEENYVLTY